MGSRDKTVQGSSVFTRFVNYSASVLGSVTAFGMAMGIVIVWGVMGPFFNYSNTWQLIINTGTTIVTFLMVFLIQNTQNRDSAAVQLKLDEIIRALDTAENKVIGLEDKTQEELDQVKNEYLKLAKDAEQKIDKLKKA